MSVAENMLLGHLPVRRVGGILPVVDRAALRRRAQAVLDDLGVTLDVDEQAGRLTFAERQLVVIGRALGRRARVLILDEPTASLERREVERLFQVIRRLRQQGVGIVYISHRLEEVQALADDCAVMRDGRIVARMAAPPFEPGAIVQAMTGHPVEVRRLASRSPGGARLEIAEPDVELACRSGEIVGLGGLLGSGATALLLRIFRGPGRAAGNRDSSQVQANIAAGVGFVPGERARALVMSLSVRDNIVLPHLHVFRRHFGRNEAAIDAAVGELIKSLDIRPQDPAALVRSLSGGNQQKVALAKWLMGRLDLLLLDEPTHGIDIAAKATIHARIEDFAAAGGSVVMSSSDMNELLELSDTVIALRRGRSVGRMQRGDGFSESILRALLEDAR
jgi:ABC-type sugar transport system ATPase subunit